MRELRVRKIYEIALSFEKWWFSRIEIPIPDIKSSDKYIWLMFQSIMP